MSDREPLHLFKAFGVELEYMIVREDTLSVLPATDKVLHEVAGQYVNEVTLGEVAWSNELALHVIELKTATPAADLAGLPRLFQRHVDQVNDLLRLHEGRLMPSAMHPWMDPYTEMRLWPHEYSPIYEAFNRIFDCRGQGWANLQSVHLNLPFAGDDEFGRLHAAIRLVLPILPALAASSPVANGRRTGLMDTRLDTYRTNSAKIPSITGRVVPEPVYTHANYQREILQPMYRDIAPYDPDGILQEEWLNSRGAIARFERNAIEIRVLDVQECPRADVALCAAIVAVLKALASEERVTLAEQQAFATDPLERILLATIRDADLAAIDDPGYLRCFGLNDRQCTAGELWQRLIETDCLTTDGAEAAYGEPLRTILKHGPLARRVSRRFSPQPSPDELHAVYGELCDCLAAGRMFV